VLKGRRRGSVDGGSADRHPLRVKDANTKETIYQRLHHKGATLVKACSGGYAYFGSDPERNM
jgi:hypothetical protein